MKTCVVASDSLQGIPRQQANTGLWSGNGWGFQQVYRRMIASEVRRCSDQWNPFKFAFARPHEAHFRVALKELKLRDQGQMTLQIVNFLRLYGRFNWGRQILGQAFRRSFPGGYDPVRWR